MNLLRRIAHRALRSTRHHLWRTPRLERLARAIYRRLRRPPVAVAGTTTPIAVLAAPAPQQPLGPTAAGVLSDLAEARAAARQVAR